MKPTLFIADLHLSEYTIDLNELFIQFLYEHVDKAAALYILGDFFETWIGDDVNSAVASQVADALRFFSQRVPVYFIAGNRDFLLGRLYAGYANMILLPDNHVIELNGLRVLLTHGDEMCTDDVQYQRYRKVIRHCVVRKVLLSLPLSWREKIAHKLRSNSHQRYQQKKELYSWSDVTEQGMQTALVANRAVNVVIHGHTHRQNIHVHQIDGKQIMRYVLPDWKNGQGGYLAVDAAGFQFFRLPENNAE